MKIETRRLTRTEADAPLFEEAMKWVEAEPEWLKELDRIEGLPLANMWEEADNPGNIIVALWNDGEYRALFSFQHSGGGAFEGHLVSKRGVKAEEVRGEIWRWGWGIFSELNAYCIYAWVPELNRVSRTMINFLCTTFDGVIRWHGVYRGRIVRWRRQTLYRTTWESWQTDGKTEDND
jgi:hypothetical protein